MEENLLGHLLKANDPASQRTVEQFLANDPSAPHDLSLLRKSLAPLAVLREIEEPSADLWTRTLARVAEHMVATEGRTTAATDDRVGSMIRRAAEAPQASIAPSVRPAPPVSDAMPPTTRSRNILGAVALSIAGLALLVPGIVHVRARSHQTACKDSMRQFHAAMSHYCDDHENKLPQVTEGNRVASMVDTVRVAGYLPADATLGCPGGPPAGTTMLAHYAYTLGFRDETGTLHGLVRGQGNDLIPLLADAPARLPNGLAPVNHRHGQNVLFLGGNVRFCTTPLVGPDQDDIFVNREGRIGAGIGPNDAALGRLEDRP